MLLPPQSIESDLKFETFPSLVSGYHRTCHGVHNNTRTTCFPSSSLAWSTLILFSSLLLSLPSSFLLQYTKKLLLTQITPLKNKNFHLECL